MKRVCEGCGATLVRAPKSKAIEWRAKRFCSPGCRVASGLVVIRHANTDVDRVAAEIGSEALFARMMDSYRSVASQRGLASVWEAAVVLGMAA